MGRMIVAVPNITFRVLEATAANVIKASILARRILSPTQRDVKPDSSAILAISNILLNIGVPLCAEVGSNKPRFILFFDKKISQNALKLPDNYMLSIEKLTDNIIQVIIIQLKNLG
jgi:hypothetical protein